MAKLRKHLMVVGVLVLVFSMATPLMQCSLGVSEETEEVTEEGPKAEEIEYGGRLTVGWLSGLENLVMDSKMVYTTWGLLLTQLCYDFVWFQGWPENNYDPVPVLGTSWETEDGKTWIWHLREDSTFHDGTPVTAEDVAFTFWYLVSADPAWQYPRTVCESYPTVIDDYTVEFVMAEATGGPYPAAAWMPIVPKHIWEPYKDDMLSFENEECVGSGPFKLKEFKPDEYIWFVVNDDYGGVTHEGRPYLDELVFKKYGSLDVLYKALGNEEIDCIGDVGCSPLVVDELEAMEHIDTMVSPGLPTQMLALNLHKDTPLQDLNVRKAIAYGIDRDRCIDMIYRGYADKIDSMVYAELPDHNPNLPQYGYDLNKANDILDNAGYVDTDGDGIRNDPISGKNLAFDLVASAASPDLVKAGTLIEEQLRDIGINIDREVLDQATYTTVVYAPEEEQFDMCFSGVSGGANSDWSWYKVVSPNAGGSAWNTAYYDNPEFDERYFKMLPERDLEKRRDYLHDMQMIMAEDLPYVFLWRASIIDPVNNRFEGYVSRMGGISGWSNPWTFEEVHLK